MFYVVAYDMPNTKRRTRLMKALKGFGIHTQFSVFECDLNDHEYERMMAAINGIINRSEDAVKVYGLCARCLRGADVVGRGSLAVEPDCIVI